MKIDATFPWDMYKFLANPLRTLDTAGVLERYVAASQEGFEQIQANISTLDALQDPNEIPDIYLAYKIWLLGWTNDLSHVISALSYDDMRRLLTISVPMWKGKGSPLGIANTLRQFTGSDTLLWDWFAFRPVVGDGTPGDQDTISLVYQRRNGDPWVIGDSDPTALYSDARDQTYIWMNNSDAPSVQLAYDLLQLNRPAEESFRLICADLVDDFQSGAIIFEPDDFTPVPTWNADRTVTLALGTSCELNLDTSAWDDFTVSLSASWPLQAPSVPSTATLSLLTNVQRSGVSLVDAYVLTVNPIGVAGVAILQLDAIQSAVSVALGFYDLDYAFSQIVGQRVLIGLRIQRIDSARHRVIATFDGEDVISVIETTPAALAPGKVMISTGSATPGDVVIDNLMAYRLTSRISPDPTLAIKPLIPPAAVESYPVTSEADEDIQKAYGIPVVRRLVPYVIWEEQFTAGLGGFTNTPLAPYTPLWHQSSHRSLTGIYSAGFVTAESAYRGGAEGNVPITSLKGELVGPITPIPSSFIAAAPSHKLFAEFSFVWAGVSAGSTTSSQVEVQDSSANWVVISDLPYPNTTWQTVRIDLETKTATSGQNLSGDILGFGSFQVKFVFNTTDIMTGGLYVDNVRLCVEDK